MKDLSIHLFLVLLIFSTSCARKKEKTFYDTGQVKEERIYETRYDTSKYYVIHYYPNGQVKSKGHIIDGCKNGNWQEWYGDGSIKWNGEYDYGKRKFEVLSAKPKIIMEDTLLRKGKQTNLKVHIDGIHPEDMAIACNNGIIKVSERKGLYDYVVTPKKEGIIKFVFFIKNEGRMIQIGTDSLNVLDY